MRIHGRVAVTLTEEHADNQGYITTDGEMHVYYAVIGAPARAQVRIDVGPVAHPSSRLFMLLNDALPDADLFIEGSARTVDNWLVMFGHTKSGRGAYA